VDWEFFVQQIVNGSPSVARRADRSATRWSTDSLLLNFAHGDVFMIGALSATACATLFGGTSPVFRSLLHPHVPGRDDRLQLSGWRSSGLQGRGTHRASRRSSPLCVSFFLQNSALLLFSPNFRSYDTFSLYEGRLFLPLSIGPLHISPMRILVIGSALGLMIVLTLVIGRTQIGRAMRATSHDREAASMMGIDVDRVIVITFLLGSALAGAAGVMVDSCSARVPHHGIHRRSKALQPRSSAASAASRGQWSEAWSSVSPSRSRSPTCRRRSPT
jgi:branched-chain amino acid transport system permease protein